MSDPASPTTAPGPEQSGSGATTPLPTSVDAVCQGGCELGPLTQAERRDDAERLRREAAHCPHHDARCSTTAQEPVCAHPCNGDEDHFHGSSDFPGQYPASYTKGLPHDPGTGLGDPTVYCKLLEALATWDPQMFEAVRPLGCEARGQDAPSPPPPGVPPSQRLLENPQSGLAYTLEGSDPAALFMPPAPAFASERQALEAAELYWLALTRDVPFDHYATDIRIADAVFDLNALSGSATTPLSPHLPAGPFTTETIFRGPTAGDRAGPYLSQFLLRDVPYGAQVIPATIRTLLPQVDFLTNWDDWLEVQDGCDANQTNCDPVPRLIRSGRDMAQFVHVDRDYNAFFNACHLMLFGRDPTRRCEARAGLGIPFGPCLPYVNPLAPPAEEFAQTGKSQNQIGQGTFGDQHVKSVLVGAVQRAFNAVWYQKWSVHRRLRPEEFGGRVHLAKLAGGGAPAGVAFPVNGLLFQSTALFGPAGSADQGRVFTYNAAQNANLRNPAVDALGQPSSAGTFLLPQAYAEGSPLHPAYGSGHSTVAGCLVTILKAFFHNDWRFPNAVEPNEDGTSVRLYTGTDVLTIAGELDKLASNVGLGRTWAGVHWRSDHEEALLLGEQLAVSILCDQRSLFNEPYEFRFRSFDFGPFGGRVVRIRPAVAAWQPGEDCEACVDCIDHYDPVLDPQAPCERRRRPGAPTADS
jgi:hypothetical protein